MATIAKTRPADSRVSHDDIRLFVGDVVKRFHPRKVILFGSYAYGEPGPESDVDLLVVMQHQSSAPSMAARIMLECPHGFPLDLLVRSPTEIRRRTELGDRFVQEITSKGIVLHEADDARMGR